MKKSFKKIIIISLKILSILPSFITSFVLFETIIPIVLGINGIFGKIGGNISLFFIILMFFCTSFPIFFLNYINWFESHEVKELNSNLLSLALSTRWREKLFTKISRRVICLSWALTFVKVLGESVALRFFCSGSDYGKPFNSIQDFFASNTHTISSLISSFYFSESGGENHRQAMFIYGAPLLIVSFLINYFLIKKSVSTEYKRKWMEKYYSKIKNQLNSQLERRKFKKPILYYWRYISFQFYIENWIKEESKRERIRKWKEILISFFLLFIFIAILLTIFIRGVYFLFYNSFVYDNSLETYTLEGLWVPLWNTFFLLFTSILWSLPICFFSALFVSVYLHRARKLKYVISSFISGCGNIPPMLWAIFSMFLFIDTLHLSHNRVSILAGILSLFILNLPFLFSRFFNLFELYLQKYSSTFLSLGLHPYNLIFLIFRDGMGKIRLNLSDSITRLNGESGLLLLTTGANKSWRMTLFGAGQTLTTKIFASLLKYREVEAKSIVYETILFLVLVIFFIFSILNGMWSGIIKFSKKYFKKIYYKSYWKGCVIGIFSISHFLSKFS